MKTKTKKGSTHFAAVIGIIAILGATAAGAGYYMYKKNMPQVKVGPDGVSVQTDGVDIETNGDGVSVQTDGADVQTGSGGTNVNTDGVNVQTNGNGVDVNTGAGAQTNGSSSGSSENTSVDTVLIFDASGSMAQQAQGDSRINLAKTAVGNYVEKLEDDVNMSVVAYGHKGNNTQAGKAASCAGIEELYYMGPVNDSVVKSKVSNLSPNGWTPITDSLKKASDILKKSSAAGEKHITLLSDGEETCGGDPVAYAKQLCAEGITVDVIGLDVSGVAQGQLEGVASACGEYYSVGSMEDFNVVIDNMGVKVNTGDVKINIGPDGARVQTGNVDINANNSGASVDAGNAHIDTTTGGSPRVDVPGVSVPSF